ncbi:MAG: PorV/PorQ family protein [Candidatus Delongbacteria bacterium]|nr:PorV/PorQ family protein [Candidatus Delongbacteria bacterium]
MRKHAILALLFGLWLMGWSDPSQGGIIKKGQVGFRFLEHPVSAEAVGRGTIGLAMTRNANAVFWNPAGLGWIEQKVDFCMNYTNGIADINHSSAALAFNLKNVGVVAFDAFLMDYGDLVGTRRAANDEGFEETGTFSPQNYCLGVSFSQRVSDRFSYGVRVKYVNEDLGDAWIATQGTDVTDSNLVIDEKEYGLSVPAFDVGVVYDFMYNSIRFAAVMQNFSREMRYENNKFPLPFAVSFSMTINPLSFLMPDLKEKDLLLAFETRHPRDFKERYKIGLEYLYKKTLTARIGYMGNYDERGLTFGLGLVQKYMNTRFRFDYAYQDNGIFNGVHVVSFGVMY